MEFKDLSDDSKDWIETSRKNRARLVKLDLPASEEDKWLFKKSKSLDSILDDYEEVVLPKEGAKEWEEIRNELRAKRKRKATPRVTNIQSQELTKQLQLLRDDFKDGIYTKDEYKLERDKLKARTRNSEK
jgi:hypothetical protein